MRELRKINQYTLEGQYIRTFEGTEAIREALRLTACARTCRCYIYRCCDKKYRLAYGYQWRYAKDVKGTENIAPVDAKPSRTTEKSAVCQYALDGTFLKKYDSIAEAAKDNGLENFSSIQSCAARVLNTAYGYQWRYADEVVGTQNIETAIREIKLFSKKICQYTLEGTLVKTYNNMIEAEKALYETYPELKGKELKANLNACCMGEQHTAYGYLWIYPDEQANAYKIFQNHLITSLKRESRKRKVNQYSLDGKYICTFPSVTAAKNSITPAANTSGIYRCCFGKSHTAYGFIWRFHDEYPENEDILPVKIRSYAINQYDLDGTFLRRYESVKEASEILGRPLHISNLLVKGKGTSYGYQWRYADEMQGNENIESVKDSAKVGQYDENGNLIQIHENMTEAAKTVSRQFAVDKRALRYGISACCHGKLVTSHGFIWRFAEDGIFPQKIENPLNNKKKTLSNAKKVNQYLLNGEYVKTFESAGQAGQEFNISPEAVRNACAGRNGTAYGYQWRYADEVTGTENIAPFKKETRRTINQYTLDGIYLHTYDSVAEAAKAIGKSSSGIYSCVRGGGKTAHGFIWKYADELPEYPKSKNISEGDIFESYLISTIQSERRD